MLPSIACASQSFAIERDRGPAGGSRLGKPAEPRKRNTEIAVCGGEFRLERDGAAVNRLRHVEPPHGGKRDGEIETGLRIIGPDRDGAAVGCLRFGKPAKLRQPHTEIVMSFGEVGREGEDFLVERYRRRDLSGVLQIERPREQGASSEDRAVHRGRIAIRSGERRLVHGRVHAALMSSKHASSPSGSLRRDGKQTVDK